MLQINWTCPLEPFIASLSRTRPSGGGLEAECELGVLGHHHRQPCMPSACNLTTSASRGDEHGDVTPGRPSGTSESPRLSDHGASTRKANLSHHNRDSDFIGTARSSRLRRPIGKLRRRCVRKNLGAPLDAGSRTGTGATLLQAVSGGTDLGHSNNMRNAGRATATVEPTHWKLGRNCLGRIGHHRPARVSSEAPSGTPWKPRTIYLVGRTNPLFE